MNKKELIQEELQDIMEMIHRYCAANRGKVCFIADFIAFDSEKIKRNKKNIIKDGSDRICIFGDKNSLRLMLNEIRNIVEDFSFEEKTDFINI